MALWDIKIFYFIFTNFILYSIEVAYGNDYRRIDLALNLGHVPDIETAIVGIAIGNTPIRLFLPAVEGPSETKRGEGCAPIYGRGRVSVCLSWVYLRAGRSPISVVLYFESEHSDVNGRGEGERGRSSR